MTREDLFQMHEDTCRRCLEIMKAKNHDYSGGQDTFSNFKAGEVIGIDPVMGILLRSMDKFKRVQTFVSKGELLVEGEGVLDALEDVINYMILAKGILIEREVENQSNEEIT